MPGPSLISLFCEFITDNLAYMRYYSTPVPEKAVGYAHATCLSTKTRTASWGFRRLAGGSATNSDSERPPRVLRLVSQNRKASCCGPHPTPHRTPPFTFVRRSTGTLV